MFLFGFFSKFNTKFAGTADATATGTSETGLLPSGEGSLVLPASWMRPGATARLILRGVCTTPALAGTATFRVKLNGTVIASASVSSLLGGQTNAGFSPAETITVRSLGSPGSASVAGGVKYPSGLGILALGAKGESDLNAVNPIAIDTTVDQVLTVTVQFSAGSHTIKVNTCTLELLEL